MDDLIRKQTILNMLDTEQFENQLYTQSERELLARIWFVVNAIPSVDAVEVVRCKDCKWCAEDYDTDGNVPYWTCKNWDGGTDADGFCYEAERKTDG